MEANIKNRVGIEKRDRMEKGKIKTQQNVGRKARGGKKKLLDFK